MKGFYVALWSIVVVFEILAPAKKGGFRVKKQYIIRRTLAIVTLLSCILFLSKPASALLMRTTIDSTFVVVDDTKKR